MEANDENRFKQLFTGIGEIYGKTLTPIMVKAYWNTLKSYSIDQVEQAVNQHLIDTKAGAFFPKPADIIRQLQGGEITTDEIISAARLHKTPLGVLCRIHIGHWDLEHQTDMFYIKQRAQECIDLLPEWKERALKGEYTDHELSCLLKYEVDPTAPVHNSLPAPQNAAMLTSRAKAIKGTDKHLALLERPHDHDKEEEQKGLDSDVSDFVRNILND